MERTKIALKIAQVAAIMVLAAAPLNQASASCEYRCEGKGAFEDNCRTICEDGEQRLREQNDKLIESFRSGSSAHFGAIAVSKSGAAYGTSTGYNSRFSAESMAIIYCEQHAEPGTCSVATWYWNTCGSLAMGSDGSWGADWASSRRSAAAKAVGRCTAAGGKDCEVKYAKCEG